MAKYNIGGYIFDDENKARKAAKELKAVEYILGQIKDADEKGVLTVYKKLLNQRLFSTEIGMSFLSQLRQNLVASGAFTEEEIPPVYSLDEPNKGVEAGSDSKSEPTDKVVRKQNDEPQPSKKTKAKKEKADKSNVQKAGADSSEVRRLRIVNRFLLVLCITLLLCVIGMFYVSTTINSPTILNYEEKLIDKYSSWEQDLTEREKALKEKELN